MLFTRACRWFRSLGFLGHIHSSFLQGMFYEALLQNCEKRLLASSVSPHETSRLPMDGFSWNLIFEYFFFSKIQVSLKSDKRTATLHEGYVRLWQYLAEIWEWNVRAKVVEKNAFCVLFFSLENRVFYVEKYGTAGQATDDNIIRRMLFECWITRSTLTMITRTRLKVTSILI